MRWPWRPKWVLEREASEHRLDAAIEQLAAEVSMRRYEVKRLTGERDAFELLAASHERECKELKAAKERLLIALENRKVD